jgi:peptide/nickel transport system permease protein
MTSSATGLTESIELKGAARPPAGLRRRGGLRGRHPVLAYAATRVAVGLLLVLLSSILVFAATQVLPGDPASKILGKYATPENVAALRQQLGLDAPVTTRYVRWLGDFLTGDFGTSVTGARSPVSSLIGGPLMNTMTLALVAMVIMVPLALALGVWAGRRAGRPADHVISNVTLGFIALPDFVLGTALILLLSTWLGLLPPISLVAPGASPLATPSALVLPVMTIVLIAVGFAIRMIRAGVIEALSSDYVQMARLNGIAERRVVYHHALRNALAPTVQVLALTLQWLIGGLFVIETVFSYPGIANGLVEAVNDKNIPYIQTVSVLIATVYIAINVVADLIVVFLVPKLRTGG